MYGSSWQWRFDRGDLNVFGVESIAGTISVVVWRVGMLLGLDAVSTHLITDLENNYYKVPHINFFEGVWWLMSESNWVKYTYYKFRVFTSSSVLPAKTSFLTKTWLDCTKVYVWKEVLAYFGTLAGFADDLFEDFYMVCSISQLGIRKSRGGQGSLHSVLSFRHHIFSGIYTNINIPVYNIVYL